MLDALHFVKGAVAKKDFIPALQHFRIKDGFIKSFNGTLGLCSPIACDLDCAPHGLSFIRAIEACTEPATLRLSEKGRLIVKSGTFRTFVDTVDATAYPEVIPQGKRVALPCPLLPALQYLESFIADDASRQWACGVLLHEQSAFATNNIVLLEYWLGARFPFRVNVPAVAIREMLRVGEEPVALQMAAASITFHYANQRWITTQLYEAQWPQTGPLLDRVSNQQPFTPGLFEALETLAPFADGMGRAYFYGSTVSTSHEPELSGSTIECPGLPGQGVFNLHQLLKLKNVANTIDFGSYPEPSIFYGGQARGLIVGLTK